MCALYGRPIRRLVESLPGKRPDRLQHREPRRIAYHRLEKGMLGEVEHDIDHGVLVESAHPFGCLQIEAAGEDPQTREDLLVRGAEEFEGPGHGGMSRPMMGWPLRRRPVHTRRERPPASGVHTNLGSASVARSTNSSIAAPAGSSGSRRNVTSPRIPSGVRLVASTRSPGADRSICATTGA